MFSVKYSTILTGSKRPTLQWFKDNVPIIPNNRLLPRGDTLMLRDVVIDDNGLYTCRMTNEIGSKTTESNVKILGKWDIS